jgi:uncharacterized Zn finger protein
MLTQTVLATVEKGRLAKAAEGYATGAYSVALVSQNEKEICGLVGTGEGARYEVVLTPARSYCGCPDAQFRHSTCKHAVVLALHVIRTPKTEAAEDERPVNLKLGKARQGFAFAA